MRLTKLTVANLRCLASLTISPKKYTTLIGPNNAGKSSTLRAIQLLLTQEKPALDEWRIVDPLEPIVLEGEFDDIQAWESAKPGMSAHVADGKVRLRVTYTISPDVSGKREIVAKYESFKSQETISGWEPDANWTALGADLKAFAVEKGFTGKKFNSAAGKNELRDLVRAERTAWVQIAAPTWSEDGFSIPAALQQALPIVQMIPAVRDAHEDGQPGAKTSFGMLLKSVIMPAITGCEEYTHLLESLKNLEKKLRGENAEQLEGIRVLSEDISKKISDLIIAKIELGLEPPDAGKFIGDSTVLRINDGAATRVSLQGHGLQRALIFALLEIIATKRSIGTGAPEQKRSTILLFEEPELFMHPHMMRRLKSVLVKISERTEWQVLASTHSPFLVDVATDPCSLVIHKRASSTQPPTVKQLTSDPFAAAENEERDRLRAVLDFHPSVCEAFFAKRVILVEGDSEIATLTTLPNLLTLAAVNQDNVKDTSVVSCDGKWTIIPIARLLRALEIPLKVIHDKDAHSKTYEELQAIPSHPFHANARIADICGPGNFFVVSDTFEDVLWEPVNKPGKSDKPYKAWKRVREICAGHANLDHAPILREIVHFAFN